MPWDVLSAGSSAADWRCCVYSNIVMFCSCQYFIISIWEIFSKNKKISCNALGCSKCGGLRSWLMILRVYKFSCVLITPCQYIIFKKHKQVKHGWVVMPWNLVSAGASTADRWFCAYINLIMYWLFQNIIKKKQQNQTSKRHRYVTMPWDVPTVGAPATDWWFYVYIDVVMYKLCKYIIMKTKKKNRITPHV